MDKIELLLKELDNRVPKSVGLRLDEYYDLCDRLEVAEEELKENPSEDNQAKFDEVNQYVSSMYDKLVASLTNLVEDKNKKEEEAEKQKREKEKSASESTETPPASTEGKPAEEENKKPEEKKGISVFGVVLGVTLLVATAGAYNYFSKNK